MNDALKLTGADLARALGRTSPAVDRAARRHAEDVARIVHEEAGVATRVLRRESGDYVVSIEGPGLAAREFGSLDAPGDAAITASDCGAEAMTGAAGHPLTRLGLWPRHPLPPGERVRCGGAANPNPLPRGRGWCAERTG